MLNTLYNLTKGKRELSASAFITRWIADLSSILYIIFNNKLMLTIYLCSNVLDVFDVIKNRLQDECYINEEKILAAIAFIIVSSVFVMLPFTITRGLCLFFQITDLMQMALYMLVEISARVCILIRRE